MMGELQLHFFESSLLNSIKEDAIHEFPRSTLYAKHDVSIEPSEIQQFICARLVGGYQLQARKDPSVKFMVSS
jgi:hypothetical protein